LQYVLYFLIAIGATTVGSLTGMGGGVIIKPLMDVLHGFDVQTIGVLSSLTVFSMSVVSIGKQMLARTKIPFGTAIPLALGSVAGGLAGEKLLQVIVDALRANSAVTVVQNVVLSLLILAVFLYMKNKSRIPSRELRGVVVSLLVGVFLGVCSSFLGIGGGPINVALIIYLFSFDTKTATVCSLVTILFAQISKLATVALTTGFGVFDLSIAPVMIVGAIAGGFIGASLNKKCSEAAVEKAFNAVQLLVLAISIFITARNLAPWGRCLSVQVPGLTKPGTCAMVESVSQQGEQPMNFHLTDKRVKRLRSAQSEPVKHCAELRG